MADQSSDMMHQKNYENNKIGTLVTSLTEIYQPVFGHPEVSNNTTRLCEDRLVHIIRVYRTLEAHLNRPLRVLDVGCAQGFFSLNLAKLGASVFGIDLQDCNIRLCNALASEHPRLNVRFEKKLIEEMIINIKQDQYDLVLGLSVFHHLVHILGLDIVQKMIAVLANSTIAGVYELALSDEATVRSSSLPQIPRQILTEYAFVHEFARHSTHLQNSSRPMYFASNHFWFLNDQLGVFETWKAESHDLSKGANNGTRRYFFGNGTLVKLFTLDNEKFHDINLQEHKNEASFLFDPPKDIKVPQLYLYGHHQNEAWLVRELLPGELLLNKILSHKSYDAKCVIQKILEQITTLEAAGYYHDDLRTWNILIGEDSRVTLIDYGAITRNRKDRGWPYNIFLSFMIFMHEVISGDLAIPNPIRPTFFNPDNFLPPYNHILWKLFEHPPAEWSFTLLYHSFLCAEQEDLGIPPSIRQSFSAIIQTMEDACQIHQSTAVYWQNNINKPDAISDQTSNN